MHQIAMPNLTSRRVFAAFLANVVVMSPASAVIPGSERNALISLYNSTNGDSWAVNANWCNGTCPASGTPVFNAAGSECTWYGISCDSGQSHVTAVGLSSNNLTGTLPALNALSNLRYFAIVSNNVSGSIPALSALGQLQTFYVADNQLSGSIPSLSGLVKLGDFSVANNHLTGAIPGLAGLAGLYSFSAAANQLSGTVPSLAGLSALRAFNVSGNSFSGAIPTLPGGLFDLEVADNQLTGALPAVSGAELHHVDVGGNRLSGGVPTASSSLYTPLAFAPSILCPNGLSTSPSANDAGWNLATGSAPWWATPYLSNRCDDIFTDRFGS